jgi:catechol 2,3-dioxygenase-like lactoylglutathione lyase family enzyme
MVKLALRVLCDHLDVRVRELARARTFYDPFCAAMGLVNTFESDTWIGYDGADPSDAFVAIEADPDFVASRTRIAFRADSREEVDRIAEVARSAGATEFEPPQDCPEYTEGYYAAFFADPDGNRYEVCYRPLSRALAARAGFLDALHADAPATELGERAEDLAWLVGGWDAVVRDYDEDGTCVESSGEWWFSWVLEGRALQDVWIVPHRGAAGARDRYGTTIRWFDGAERVWKISWFNPVSGARTDLAGTRQENRFVFEGTLGCDRIRWSFNDITPNGLVWRGERIAENGAAILGAEFALTRKPAR